MGCGDTLGAPVTFAGERRSRHAMHFRDGNRVVIGFIAIIVALAQIRASVRARGNVISLDGGGDNNAATGGKCGCPGEFEIFSRDATDSDAPTVFAPIKRTSTSFISIIPAGEQTS